MPCWFHCITPFYLQDEKIENAEAWDRLTSPVTSDNHTEQLYPFRFSYMYAQRSDKFLMVTDDGKVTVNGDVKDPRST